MTRPFEVKPPDSSTPGRCAIHQGGIIDTPAGEWWLFAAGNTAPLALGGARTFTVVDRGLGRVALEAQGGDV